MGFLFFMLTMLTVAAAVGIRLYNRNQASKRAELIQTHVGTPKESVARGAALDRFGDLPTLPNLAYVGIASFFMLMSMFNSVFFYAEPGYKYHVRTILGQENVVDDVGYNVKLFGRVNEWKKAMTVQASIGGEDKVNSEGTDKDDTSVSLSALNITFLDQVDADAAATARFRLPDDPDTFLHLVHEYRTPDNFLRTSLIPAFKETLQATASLMAAEEYYSGSRTEFNTEFQGQMQDGIYVVKRTEVRIKDDTAQNDGSANASTPEDQTKYGDASKVIFRVEKQLNANGIPLRKSQGYVVDYGVNVMDARITEMKPNDKFVERMQLKQKASADRSIAREQRIQEEEQKLLAEAKGQREVAERQAKALVEQIQATTEAETEKQLAITSANKFKEQALIEKMTAATLLDKAQIEAQSVKVMADAEAYRKRKVIEADNALAQKLDAEIEIQKVWADAFAKRAVPATVFGGGGGTPTGSDSEVTNFMNIMTMDAAKRLNYDRKVKE